MSASISPMAVTVVLLSELVAIYVIWRIAKSDDFLWVKIALSAIALIPIVGPIVAFWIATFPSKAPETLQDTRSGPYGGGRYYLRWSGVLGEKNPVRRFRLWRNEVERTHNADP